MLQISFEKILENINVYRLEGASFQGNIDNCQAIQCANSNSIVWVNSNRADKYELIGNTSAKLVICDGSIDFNLPCCTDKTFIVVDNPKLSFLRLINILFSQKRTWGIHETAVIDSEAVIHPNSYIGPFSYVGKSTIAEGTIVHGHCHIYDNCEIGSNVVLHANTVIGSDGFGFMWNKEGEIEKFLHIGKVVIEDNVEIYPFSNVDRGTLSETIIKKGSKIDHFCHIGHNSKVGESSILTAGTTMCGGSEVGKGTWIGVNTIIKEKIKVGNNCLIGLGTLVTKNIPDGETWLGVPARKLKEFVKLQKIFKGLLKND